MIPSSLSPARTRGVPAQDPSLPASGHLHTAAADPLQPPHDLPALRRRAQPDASAPTRWRTALPPGPATAAVQAIHPGRAEAPPADQAIAMTLARAEEIANEVDYGQPLALASDNYAVLFQCLLKTYDVAHQCRSEWLTSGEKTHQAAAQTLAIKAALLNGLYVMRRCHKEWNIDPPVISLKVLRNVLPLFRHALRLCETQSHAVRFPIEGLHPALAYLEKQARLSLHCLEAGPAAAGSQTPLPASISEHQAACLELGGIARQLQAVLVHGPVSTRTDPVEGNQGVATPSPPWQRSFKSVLITDPPAGKAPDTVLLQPAARPAPHPAGAGPATGKPSAQRTIRESPSRSAPRHEPVRREPRPIVQGLETLHLAGRPAPGGKAGPRHPGGAGGSTARPVGQSAGPAAWPETARHDPLPPPTSAPTVAAERPVDPAAEAAARQRQEQLAGLRGALAPLRSEASRLKDAAQASAGVPAPAGLPWARHASDFTAWQSVAQAYDACAEALAAYADEFRLGRSDPAVRNLGGEFDAAFRGALARATQAAESALAVFLQAWEAALDQEGPERAGMGSCAALAACGRELQQQWLDAPLWPQMPVLQARMAVFDACEALSDVKTVSPTAPHKAVDLLCQATVEARQASEGAKGDLGNRLRTFLASCKGLRDKRLCETVHREFEAAKAAHADTGSLLRLLLDRSREIATACDVLLIGDPLPAAKPGWHDAHTAPAGRPMAVPAPDHDLIETARHVAARLRAQREQAIQLPPDAPAQPRHDQEAVLGVLRQSELRAESAAAAITSFHELNEALPQAPLDEQPTLARSHARAMRERAEGLKQLLLAQEGMAEKIPEGEVGDLVERSCAQLCHDLRHAQTMLVSLETLAELLDARVSADHACRKLSRGSRTTPAPELGDTTHERIAGWVKSGMGRIEKILEDEQNGLKTKAWKDEKDRLDKATGGWLQRIECDSAMIQGKYFLQDLAIVTSTPDAATLQRLDVVEDLVQRSIKRSQALAQVNARLETHAASSPHKSAYQAQIGMNKEVHQQLRTAQRQLLVTLAALRAQAPAETTAGSSEAEVPAKPAAHEGRSSTSRSSRKSRTGRR